MLCPTCPKRATCASACAELKRELIRLEQPQRETTKTSEQLERIEQRIANRTFFGESFDYGEDSGPVVPKLLVDRDRLSAALETLTPRQEECLRLFFWDGLSKKTIARRLGIARQTVIQHIESALTAVRGYYLIGALQTTYTPAPIVERTKLRDAS